MASFIPKFDKVLVKPDAEIAHASQVGILIAPRDGKIIDSQTQFGRAGVVVAIGPGRKTRNGETIAPQIQVGDRVYYGEFINAELELDGQLYNVISEMDITGVENASQEINQ